MCFKSNRTLTAKFLELIPKTFYFDAGQGGSVSDTRVTYCLGDPEITVLAQPDAGWKIEYWEAMLNGKWNMASDREYLIVDDYLYNLKSASNLNGNLNCSKELEHYAS